MEEDLRVTSCHKQRVQFILSRENTPQLAAHEENLKFENENNLFLINAPRQAAGIFTVS
jgi:hypothetical protein